MAQVRAIVPGKTDVHSMLYYAATAAQSRPLEPLRAQKLTKACESMQTLRMGMYTVCADRQGLPASEMAKTTLLKYFRALDMVAAHVDTGKQTRVMFRWMASARDPNEMCESNQIIAEKASVLFNLACSCSRIGEWQFDSRGTDSLREAAKEFQQAAGFFKTCSEMLVQRSAASDDWQVQFTKLSIDYVRALEILMLGNAQAAFYEVATTSGLADDQTARIAGGARNLFLLCSRKLEQCPEKPEDLFIACQILESYFEAELQSKMALHHRANHDMAPRLTRLQLSLHAVYRARGSLLPMLRSTRMHSNGLLDKPNFISTMERRLELIDRELRERHAMAKDENDKIYLAVPASRVDDVEARVSVKSSPVQSLIDSVEIEPDVISGFSQLMSVGKSGPALEYANMVSQMLSSKTQSVSSALAPVEELLSLIHIQSDKLRDPSVLATSSNDSTRLTAMNEAKLKSALEAVKGGGIQRLRSLEAEVMVQSEDCKRHLAEILASISREEADDATLFHQLSTANATLAQDLLRTRRRSQEVSAHYRATCDRIRSELNAAGRADEQLRTRLASHADMLSKLEDVSPADLDVSAVSTVAPFKAKALEQIGAEMRLAESLSDSLIAKCKKSLETLESIAAADELTSDEIPADASKRAEFFAKRMESQYGKVHANIAQQKRELFDVEQQLMGIMDRTLEQNASGRNALEEKIQLADALEESASEWATLCSYLNEGLKFYASEKKNLVKLAQDVLVFTEARKTEGDQISNELNRRMAGMSLAGAGYPQHSEQAPASGAHAYGHNPYGHNPYGQPSSNPYSGIAPSFSYPGAGPGQGQPPQPPHGGGFGGYQPPSYQPFYPQNRPRPPP
ncbi:Programmed cell death 6-interacting protein [Porphyridium purpureum]|uniref:Programmed cell death 6-interacting protein n=1 Tax=Porphyridium purpureum TaxID=35688 RepID=A0A5J4YS51_PORPP|nr:Programmed cell death 6-interacting protein [Porphyridium purpureum]|eukprot:POR3883..scf236_6